MVSWNLRPMLLAAAKRPSFLGILTCVLLAAGCAKAASVFFDLPEPQEGSRQRPQTEAYNAFVQDTGPPPPIESLVSPDAVLAVLPRDRAGYVDWVAALRDEVIRPRRTLPGVRPPMNVSSFGFDFVYEGQSPMFDAYFPHSSHTELLSCETCHPEIFPYRNSEINMAAIGRGESCGVCHRTVAFPATACERCHRQMQMPEDRVEATLGSDVVLARTSPDSSGSNPAA